MDNGLIIRLDNRVFRVKTLMDVLGGRPKLVVKFAHRLGLESWELSSLLRLTCPDVTLVQALSESELHSGSLQQYVVELGYEYLIQHGEVADAADPVHDKTEEVLTALVKDAQVKVAETIEEIADAIETAMATMPSRNARLEVKSLVKVNKKTGRIGVDETLFVHDHQPTSLVILDCSGSMGENLIRMLVDEVVAMAEDAQATLAIVSNSSDWWEPGEYNTKVVLDAAQYGGTQYETLATLLDRDWSVVVTVADYDSSISAKHALAKCRGKVGKVLDISVVDIPTFLGECVGQLADEVEVLIVGSPALSYSY